MVQDVLVGSSGFRVQRLALREDEIVGLPEGRQHGSVEVLQLQLPQLSHAGPVPLLAGHVGQIDHLIQLGHPRLARRVAGDGGEDGFVLHAPLGAGEDGRTDAVPEVFREHRLASVSYFALCRPMMEMIELQVWLAQGQAVKVLARCEELLAACQRFHYGLVALHVRVQMAAAYGLYGQPAEARAALEQALAEAAPDGFWMPLAENYRYLAPLLAQGGWGSAQPLVERAIALGQRYEARRAQLNGSADRPAIAAALTEKELALARLVAQRRTNKEIAETLHLSEGTVKQYINQLYAKLDIGGAVRNKRAQLAALFGTKY